jgi:rhodanese-related sulfurtransferase
MSNRFLNLCSFAFLFCLSLTSVGYAEKSEYRSPEHVEGAITISVLDAKKLFDQGVVFIDVRNPRYYAKAHIPNAFHADLKQGFSESILDGIVRKDQKIVFYCSGVKCSRSYRASAKALGWGFSKVYYFRGGIAEWKKEGYEITKE